MILGGLLMLSGCFFIAFPHATLIPRLNGAGSGKIFWDWLSKPQNQICGVLEIILGAGLIWLVRWPRWGARNAAIDHYVWSLSQELWERFGPKYHYGIEEVSQLARDQGFDLAYLAYAHAMFCSRADFDDYYGPLHVRCTYDGLRKVIGRRYFNGMYGFDAGVIVHFAKPPNDEEFNFYEGGGV